jgi:hypothetical protein
MTSDSVPHFSGDDQLADQVRQFYKETGGATPAGKSLKAFIMMMAAAVQGIEEVPRRPRKRRQVRNDNDAEAWLRRQLSQLNDPPSA